MRPASSCGPATGCRGHTRPNEAQLEMMMCLPTAPALPTEGNGDFGRSPIYQQLSDKPLLVLCRLLGVPDVKHNSRSRN